MDELEPYREARKERRIRNRLRMIKRARRYFFQGNYYAQGNPPHINEEAEMHARYMHNNLCACSCDACGNQRNSGYSSGRFRLTIQERRAIDNANDFYKDMGFDNKRRKS